MITPYDYLNILFYLLFIAGVGVYFSRRAKNTSDYFRAGGMLPWWVTGASSWMAGFSAWSFTGAAGKMFHTGAYTVLLFYSILVPFLILYCFTCYRFRRMQVVTPFEAVRLRFGQGSQIFFTWARLPFMLVFGGVTLNATAVFMSAVLDVETAPVIVGLGVAVTVLALLGGSFGVAASDFVQMFMVVAVTLLVAVLALSQPDIGGVAGLVAKAPPAHTEWGSFARPQFIVLWFLGLMITKGFEENSIDKSAKYLMTRSDRHARMTLIIPVVGTLVAPLLWLVPPTVAAIRHGHDISVIFGRLKFPEEGAFLLTASEVLPTGMLGLLVCGIFAATLTTMDAGLNQGAGIFVRNFYLPVLRPGCGERRLLLVSKVSTGVFGLIMIASAMAWESMREMQLFDLVNQVAISLGLPMAVPLVFGLFWRRTPRWAAWSTVLVGLAASFTVKLLLEPGMVAWIPGMEGPYKPEEVTTFHIFASVLIVVSVCALWFFGTSWFYDPSDTEYMADLDEFFGRLRTPVVCPTGDEARGDDEVAGVIGRLCIIYGAFVASLVWIPNAPGGRLCFVACGSVMAGVGGMIRMLHRRPPPAGKP